MFGGSRCQSCSTQSLDPLVHHALTCRYNGNVVSRHNQHAKCPNINCHDNSLGTPFQVTQAEFSCSTVLSALTNSCHFSLRLEMDSFDLGGNNSDPWEDC